MIMSQILDNLIQARGPCQQMKQHVVNKLTPIDMIYEEEIAKLSASRTVLATSRLIKKFVSIAKHVTC